MLFNQIFLLFGFFALFCGAKKLAEMRHGLEFPLYFLHPSIEDYFFGKFGAFEMGMLMESAKAFRPNAKIYSLKNAQDLLLEILTEPSEQFKQFNKEFPEDCKSYTAILEDYDFMIPQVSLQKTCDFHDLLFEIVSAMKEFASQSKRVELPKIEAFNRNLDQFLLMNNLAKRKKYSIDPHQIRTAIDQAFFGAFDCSTEIVKGQIVAELRKEFRKIKIQPKGMQELFNLESQRWTSAQFKRAIEFLHSEDRSFSKLRKTFHSYTACPIEINDDLETAFGKAAGGFQLPPDHSIMLEYRRRMVKILKYYRIHHRHDYLYFYFLWREDFEGLIPTPEI